MAVDMLATFSTYSTLLWTLTSPLLIKYLSPLYMRRKEYPVRCYCRCLWTCAAWPCKTWTFVAFLTHIFVKKTRTFKLERNNNIHFKYFERTLRGQTGLCHVYFIHSCWFLFIFVCYLAFGWGGCCWFLNKRKDTIYGKSKQQSLYVGLFVPSQRTLLALFPKASKSQGCMKTFSPQLFSIHSLLSCPSLFQGRHCIPAAIPLEQQLSIFAHALLMCVPKHFMYGHLSHLQLAASLLSFLYINPTNIHFHCWSSLSRTVSHLASHIYLFHTFFFPFLYNNIFPIYIDL